MKKVINNRKEISLDELVDNLQSGQADKVVFYISRSTVGNDPYPAIFKKLENLNKYGFVSPIFSYNSTYSANTIRESLSLAIGSGKNLMVLERNEVNQIFKKINEL